MQSARLVPTQRPAHTGVCFRMYWARVMITA